MLKWQWVTCVCVSSVFYASCATTRASLNNSNIGPADKLWLDVPTSLTGTQCAALGSPGVCVPIIAQCPILELQFRSMISVLMVSTLQVFIKSCETSGGYCCPDASKTPTEDSTETNQLIRKNPISEISIKRGVQTTQKPSVVFSESTGSCEPIPLPSRNLEITCRSFDNKVPKIVPCDNRLPNKAQARVRCKQNQKAGENKFIFLTCRNGKWDRSIPQDYCIEEPLFKNGKLQHKNRNLLPEETCGIDLTSASRIVGGNEASLGEFPWLALISVQFNGKKVFYCGGSLISSRYVISAAHCFDAENLPKNSNIDSVRLGEHDIEDDRDCMPNGECGLPVQDIPVESFIVHENYAPRSLGYYDDIALVRLERPAELNLQVSPICLPMDQLMNADYARKKMEVTGWGKISNNFSTNIKRVKMKVAMPFVDQEVCAPQYLKRGRIELRDTQLCAGGERGKDSCQGDSGGPVMYTHLTDYGFQYVLVGIASFGPKECGEEGLSAVYTRVGKYIKWILDNMAA